MPPPSSVSHFQPNLRRGSALLCRHHLLPLLLLSLVTSTFGFSVGPEAPMVCAGGLIGASLSRRFYGSSLKNQEVGKKKSFGDERRGA